jgi:hypothetical protein
MLFWKKLLDALFGPGHKPRPRRSARPGVEQLEERENPAPVIYTWNATADGNWNNPANWTGGTAGQYPGQGTDDVANFTNNSVKKCTLTASLPNSLDALVLAGNFSGTLQLNSPLTVTGADRNSLLGGGFIAQPNGGGSNLIFTGGVVTWGFTIINNIGFAPVQQRQWCRPRSR